jgi:hypothetical protein
MWSSSVPTTAPGMGFKFNKLRADGTVWHQSVHGCLPSVVYVGTDKKVNARRYFGEHHLLLERWSVNGFMFDGYHYTLRASFVADMKAQWQFWGGLGAAQQAPPGSAVTAQQPSNPTSICETCARTAGRDSGSQSVSTASWTSRTMTWRRSSWTGLFRCTLTTTGSRMNR